MQKVSKHSKSNLRNIFYDTTKTSAYKYPLSEIESLMYLARRLLQLNLPLSVAEFCDMLPDTSLDTVPILGYMWQSKFTSILSNVMKTFLAEVSNVPLDVTSYNSVSYVHYS